MNRYVIFTLGLLLGSTLGIIIMGLMSAARDSDVADRRTRRYLMEGR